ncbi:MAG: glycosyltransferase [Actinomyces urogenitalis]|uniref:CgeB family protein n=1 Tax=Actinomyces urogenitalis TaxID=103621 RepID=UPI002A828C6F|nr:glycosyltransferase [Actinomyces urogenitalis]MDY3677857.1 glycosyltransferase [Actinomyces urogenitalis]
MRTTRLLLVSPQFRTYWQAIAHAFRQNGYVVDTYVYDARPSFLGKLHHKLRFELPDLLGSKSSGTQALSTWITDRAAQAVRETHPDVVVVIKGDVLGEAFWDAIETCRAKSVSWFYDELRRMTLKDADSSQLTRRRAIATYSALDAQALSLQVGTDIPVVHLPLAFDDSLRFSPWSSAEISFIGARYGDRELLLTALTQAGVPTRAYGRDWSHHPVDRLRTWSLHRPSVPADRDLDRAEAYAVMAGSAATINVHGDQDGFTMRTFEACGVGGLQLIDRNDVTELYEPDRELLVFNSAEELVELSRRALRDERWTTAIRQAGRRRTLAKHTFAARVPILESIWN